MDILNFTGKVLYAQLSRDEMRFALLGNGGELLSCHTLPTPAGAVADGNIQNAEAISALLKKVMRRPEFKECRKIAFSLCTSQVITETVTTPDLPAKRLEKLLQANMDMYFPVDMKNYKLQWQVIGPKMRGGQRELQVQLWAVPIDMLAKYYEVANSCNLSVARIDYCGNSIAAAVGASFARPVKAKERVKLSLNTEITFGKKKQEEEIAEEPAPVKQQAETQLHIFVDNDLLGATFVQNGQVVQQRFISCGANPSYQFYELAMMVEFFGSTGYGRGSKLTGFITGSLADDAQIVSELSDILGIPMSVPANTYDPKFVLCVGAAASNVDFGIPAMDVPKSGRKSDSQVWQYGLLIAAGVLLIGSVILLLTSRLSWTSQVNNLNNQQQTLLIQVKKTAGYKEKYDKYDSDYKKYSADWDTIFNNLRTYNDNLVLALDELEQTLPMNTDVVAMQIAPDGLTVQFACKTKEEAAYLIMALRELEYMELVGISNLSGGGGGPATSYGPSDVETPPVDGSYGSLSDQQVEILAGIMMANMDQKKMMNTFLGLSDDETQRLEKVYAKNPSNKYATLKALRGAYNAGNIFQQRCDALHEMLTTNPFAVQSFVELVKADVKAENPILMPHILMDLMQPSNSDMLEAMMSGSIGSAEQAFGYMERLIAILCKNNTSLTATEDLLATDSKMEKWYIYYLEMELGLQSKSAIGFLDMDKVVADLMEGSFNTGDKALDAKLNALIPDAVWSALETMKNMESTPGKDPSAIPNPGPDDYSRAKLMAMLKKYASTGKTGDAYLDQLIQNYLETGKSGDDRWDAWLKQYEHFLTKGGAEEQKPEITKKPSDYAEEDLIAKLFQYLSTNTSGDDYLDGLLDYYLTTGSTGDRAWDNWLKPYKQYLTEQEGASTGSPGQYPVYFVVALKYKEELIKAELDRKGLDYSEKIERVEVLG